MIISGEDITNGKPHPEPYLKTAEKLGVVPANALVIEDSVNGVRSGKAAGLSCHCDYHPSASDGDAGGLRGRFLYGIGVFARF